MAKQRINIIISGDVLHEIRKSGVRNVSKYFEGLAMHDLANLPGYEKYEKDQLAVCQKEMAYWTKEWYLYLEKTGQITTADQADAEKVLGHKVTNVKPAKSMMVQKDAR